MRYVLLGLWSWRWHIATWSFMLACSAGASLGVYRATDAKVCETCSSKPQAAVFAFAMTLLLLVVVCLGAIPEVAKAAADAGVRHERERAKAVELEQRRKAEGGAVSVVREGEPC